MILIVILLMFFIAVGVLFIIFKNSDISCEDTKNIDNKMVKGTVRGSLGMYSSEKTLEFNRRKLNKRENKF